MSGQVIHRPEAKHACRPGWTYREPSPQAIAMFGPHQAAEPPREADYPRGTQWQCDDCGQVWVSQGAHPGHYNATSGMVYADGMAPPQWRKERWLERRRRNRRAN